MTDEITKLKDEANELFKIEEYEKAISLFNKALSICRNDELTCILHKNTAASYLKLNKYNDVVRHCDKALEIKPEDPKALYRRACACENLERFEEAYRDAQKALVSSPSDAKTFKPMLTRLHPIVEQRRNQRSQTKEKASKMLNLAFGTSNEEEIDTGLNNILVLCRERAGIEALFEIGLLVKLKSLLEVRKPNKKALERKIVGVRILSQIVYFDISSCKRILTDLGVPFVMNLQDLTYGFTGDKSITEEAMTSIHYLWQSILDALSRTKKGEKVNKEMLQENSNLIDALLTTMTMSLNSRTIPGEARDVIMQIFTQNLDHAVLGWAEKFIDIGGMIKLADIGCEVPELKIESAMNITPNTRSLLAVLLSLIYENMYYDTIREKYVNAIDEFTKDLLLSPDTEGKIRVASFFTVLLMGPFDVGNTFIGRPGILQMILVMANTEEYIQQRVATEAIVAAANKQDKAKGIIADGVNILKRLYQSKNDDIKVRALVGLCKLGSSGGTDAAWRPFSEGSTLKLAEACRRFLLNPLKDVVIQRWAIEGLSYLSLDAEVKEKLIEDAPALRTMLEISSHANNLSEIVYPIITTLVNLVNAYDKQEVIPEMQELAKFAKHHIPEEHEFDDADFVENRVETLAKLGVTTCLVNLTKATESKNVMELISRVLNAICERVNLRGMVVAQGGARELLKIANSSTDKGKINAAHALARIGVTQAPSVAFPGQRMYEVIKHLLLLLEVERTAIQNFEALLALCNIVGESEACRMRVWDEKGYLKIEHYIYEDHQKLKTASLQCLLNMCISPRTQEIFDGDNERVKYMMMLCSPVDDLSDEDVDEIEAMKAAAGVLAMVTSHSRGICGKVLTSIKNPLETLIWLVANPMVDMQIRGVTIVKNVISADKEMAAQIVGSPIFEIILVLSTKEVEGDVKLKDDPKKYQEDLKKKENFKVRCLETLKTAEKWELIEKN